MKSKTSRGDSYFVVEINGIYETITKENRQFILNACNSHEALIEALKLLVLTITSDFSIETQETFFREPLRKASLALKEAGKK